MVSDARPLTDLNHRDAFIGRHIGPDTRAIATMLDTLGEGSIASLIDRTIPADIRLKGELPLAGPRGEQETLEHLRSLMSHNRVARSHIGAGYYDTIMPAVIARNVLENPGWYTAYTPYQPEIAQGRLEGLLNFQQMVMDLTGMGVANASLLDEATAAAEAMTLCHRANRKAGSQCFFVARDVFPQTLDVLRTRAEWQDIELIVDDAERVGDYQVFGALLQYPGDDGRVIDLQPLIDTARHNGAMVAVAADLLALTLLTPPGEMGADIVLGSAQRFGIPMGFGGPHAAYLAVTNRLKRSIPGRVIGVSRDRHGGVALRMAMQTREQHIRREKATSNICTAQALLANLAGFYAVYHGADGLHTIASRIHRLTALLTEGLAPRGIRPDNHGFFDTLTFSDLDREAIETRALADNRNLRYHADGRIGVSFDETTTAEDVLALIRILSGKESESDIETLDRRVIEAGETHIPDRCQRQSTYLTHPVFQRYRSETEMLRYLKRLENRDLSLTHAMIPLGSCTMKLNATTEMAPLSWPECTRIHPFAPRDQVEGYHRLIEDLIRQLADITGYDTVSMQPNSGAQGEYAGLVAIRRYQQEQGEGHRHICLIPSSAHGTNPASAAMARMKVVVVECDVRGNIDMDDLRRKAAEHAAQLSAIMLTYPSTHGVFEADIQEACRIVHEHGGQVYIDGANMNAQTGLCRPGDYGGDVSHLNLHKTFCIPHGGGGPGMGPIGVKAHLAPHLPDHVFGGHRRFTPGTAVSAAAYGSALILPISWAYITMMGARGLREASEIAILGANYIASRLESHYPILYRGDKGTVAHECIIDIRSIKNGCGIDEEDIAKRLMDYGFHAPTMSFPVAGTLMVEPTESESLLELDRFCDAMIAIRHEIRRIEHGEWSGDNNPLVNAPHTQRDLYAEEWPYPYSRELAAFPSEAVKQAKFWPSVSRVDNVHGDRNLICSCPSIDEYRD